MHVCGRCYGVACGSGECVAGEVALNGCTVPGVGVWVKLALVPAAPWGPALSHRPLWLIQGVFLFLFPLPEGGRDASAPATVRAEAGVHSLRGGTEHPAPLLPVLVGTVTRSTGDRGSALRKQAPSPQPSLCPLRLIISSCGFQYPRAGSCLWDHTLEGGPAPGVAPLCPRAWPCRVTAGCRGGSSAPLSPGGEHPGPAQCLPSATAPYQHLPSEPAQMLQECGSATTRYCRNAPRVGKGQTGACPASTIPSTRQAAACAPHLGGRPPPPELGSPLRPWGRLWVPRPLGVQRATFCSLFYCCWAGKWVIRAETGEYPVGLGCSERGWCFCSMGSIALGTGPSWWCSTPVPLLKPVPPPRSICASPQVDDPHCCSSQPPAVTLGRW